MVALSVLAVIAGSGCSGPAKSAPPKPSPPPGRVGDMPTSLGGANLVSYADSDFETGVGDWTPVTNASLTIDTHISFLHGTSLKDVLRATGASSFQLGRNRRIAVAAGGRYRVGAYFDVPTGSGRSVTFGVRVYDSARRPLGWMYGSSVSLSGTGGWQYASALITMPAAAAYVAGSPRVTYSGGRAGETVHVDEVQFTPYRAAMLIGADAGKSGAAASWMAANDTIGSLQIDKIFYPRALPQSYSGSTCAALPKDVVCLVAYKIPTVNVTSFVSSIPAYRAVVMIFHHEPEGDFPSGSNYVAQFEAQSTLIRRAARDAPNVFVADDVASYQYLPGHQGANCSYVPPAAYTDFYLADHYQTRPNGQELPNGQNGEDWTTWLNCVSRTHKPIGLAEYGLGACGAKDGTTRAQSLLADNSYLKDLPSVIGAPVLIWSYWWVHQNPVSSCQDWKFGGFTEVWRSIQAGR
jgi:hypothetical protein